MNDSNAENFMRLAKDPQIGAGVMIAKVIWKHMYTDSGMVRARSFTESRVIPSSRKRLNPPTNDEPQVKAMLWPTTIHKTVTRQAMEKLCINVAKTFILRTMPTAQDQESSSSARAQSRSASPRCRRC